MTKQRKAFLAFVCGGAALFIFWEACEFANEANLGNALFYTGVSMFFAKLFWLIIEQEMRK